MNGGERIQAAIRRANAGGRTALVPYVVAGRPSLASFAEVLVEAASLGDVVEIGLPFSDPVADGPVIASASRAALEGGVSLSWLLRVVAELRAELRAPLVLMSYLNPLLARGERETLRAIRSAGFDGIIVPDLPLGAQDLDGACKATELARIHLATPLSSRERLDAACAASAGFLYAVLRSGITGANSDTGDCGDYLQALRRRSRAPVCAGFGLRTPSQVRDLRPFADGLIVGSALVEDVERGVGLRERLSRLSEAAHIPTTELTP